MWRSTEPKWSPYHNDWLAGSWLSGRLPECLVPCPLVANCLSWTARTRSHISAWAHAVVRRSGTGLRHYETNQREKWCCSKSKHAFPPWIYGSRRSTTHAHWHMMQYKYSSYTNSTKTNLISVWKICSSAYFGQQRFGQQLQNKWNTVFFTHVNIVASGKRKRCWRSITRCFMRCQQNAKDKTPSTNMRLGDWIRRRRSLRLVKKLHTLWDSQSCRKLHCNGFDRSWY